MAFWAPVYRKPKTAHRDRELDEIPAVGPRGLGTPGARACLMGFGDFAKRIRGFGCPTVPMLGTPGEHLFQPTNGLVAGRESITQLLLLPVELLDETAVLLF